MNDERDHDGKKIRKYYGPPKTNTVEQYASANLNNNAFANEDSMVKPKDSATGKGPSNVMDIKPISPTGKKKGDDKKIKVVDKPPKKEEPQIPTVEESAEKKETPKVETPMEPPVVEPPKIETPPEETPTEPPQDEDKNETVSPPVVATTDETRTDKAQTDKGKPTEFDPYGGTDTDTDENPDILSERKGSVLDDGGASKQKEWKPSVTSQRLMDAGLAGLNMFGNVMGGANKAFSMLRGLASALTSRQLMSDPTLPARGFLNAMDQSGQIVEDHIRQVGEAYGIKDGVKRDDLVGTYKGAQYYREKQQIENTEKQYYAGVGNALSAVLGSTVNVNDPNSIQNALARMTPQQLSQLDDALFGQNGALKDMYDATVTNPVGSTREQKARAQLLTTLNQSLKGQAQANAREAGRRRTQANQQIQQLRQQGRQLRETDMANYRQAQQQVADPASMAGMSGREQMRAIIHSAIGRRIMSGDIPMQRSADGQWGMLNTDQLDINALNSIRRALEGGQVMNHPATQQAAQQLYNEVQGKLNEARQNGVRFRQQQRQSVLNALMDSPLEYDIEDRGGRRDRYGIPESAAGRRTLYNNAWYTMQDLIARGGDKKDIALCENVMQMCDMADFREGLMNDVRRMEKDGSITPMEADLVRQNADRAYEEMASALPMTRARRDEYINKGQDWMPNQRTEAIYNNMQTLESNLDNITRYHAQAERERRAEMAQAERDERMKPYQNSPVDLDINSGSKADRDSMGIPTDKGKRNKLYVKAQNMLRDLRQNGGDQNDIDLCRNVMTLCDLADRRDELTNTVRDLRKSGAISALEEEMYLDEANRYYDLASAELATTVDDRNARIEAGEDWTENYTTENMSAQMDNLHDIIEETRTGYTAQERDRRRAQEQARRDAQRTAEMEPYQNSPVDLDLMNGRGGGNRDRYHIPKTYSGQRNLRNNADDMIRTLIEEGGSPEDISLCENVRTLANAAMHRSEIESYLSKLEAKGKISKEEAELARQNAFRAYTDLADRLPVTVKDRNARIQAKQDWEQDDNTDNLSIDLESTMNHLKYLEGEYDTRIREDREAMREQRRRERAENRARAAENARQERADEWEAQANRDGRGISLASDPKYRKKDVQKWGDQLKRIEADMMNATSPETMLRLTKEKMDVETKIRQTLQEDHIQKLIAKAGAMDPFTRAEITKRAEALRDTTSDWNDFGKALNDIYKDYQGLGSDRTWASSRKAEEAQRKQAKLDSIGGRLDQMIKLMNELVTGQGSINNSIWTSKQQMFSQFEDYLDTKFRGQVQAMGRNRNQLIEAFTDFYKDTVKKDVEGMVGNAVSTLTGSMKDSCDRMEGAIKGLGQEAQDRFMPLLQDISGNTAYLTRQLKGFYTKSDGDVTKILDAARKQAQAINDLEKAINGFSSLGGQYIDGPLKIDAAQWEELKSQFIDLGEYKKSMDDLVEMYRNGAYPSAEEISKTFLELMSGYDRHNPDLEGEDPERWKKVAEMFQRFDETREKADAVLTNIQLFNSDRENFAVPATLVDDFNEFLRQEHGDQDRSDQILPSGEVNPDAREEASETVPESVSEATDPEQVSETDQPDEMPPVTAEDDGKGEIYEDRYVDPETGVYTPPKEQNPSEVEQPFSSPNEDYREADAEGRVYMAFDELLDRYPTLNEYTKEHPETLKYLRRVDPDGSIHQTLRGAAERAEEYELFEGNATGNILAMMDDFLSQTSPDDLNAVRDEWLQLADSQGTPDQVTNQRGVVQNIKGMAGDALSGVFREAAARRLSTPPEGTYTGAVDPEVDEMNRALRVMAESMLEEQRLASQGLDEEAIKKKMAEEEAERKRAAEERIRELIPEQQTEVGRRMAGALRDRLFRFRSDPQWSDYRSVMDQFAEMKKNYPQAIGEIDSVRDDVVFGMVVPQLMGFKNVANVAPSDKMTKEKIKEISRRAMEIGLTRRQEVINRANEANLAGKDYKFTKEDEYWLGFPTVEELVNSHIYGRDHDNEPVNINKARVRRQEGGNKYNNRLAETFREAAKSITLKDLAQSRLEAIRNANPYTGFVNRIQQVSDGVNGLPSADDLWSRYRNKDETLDINDVNTTLDSYRTAVANANKLREDINKHLDDNKLPTVVSNEYGEMEVPQDILKQMNDARTAHASAAGMSGLDKFFAGGDVSKQLLSLEALKEQMHQDKVKADYGLDDETAKKVIDWALKQAGESGKFENYIEKGVNKFKPKKNSKKGPKNTGVPKDTKKAEEPTVEQLKQQEEERAKQDAEAKFKNRSATAEKMRDDIMRKVDPYNKFTSPEQAMKAIVDRYWHGKSDRQTEGIINQLANQLGLKKTEEIWKGTKKNLAIIANAVVNGSKNEHAEYGGAWNFSRPAPAEEPVAEESKVEEPVEEPVVEQSAEQPAEQPVVTEETPAEAPEEEPKPEPEPEKQDYYTETKTKEGLKNDVGEWFKNDADVQNVLRSLPENVTQEQWTAAGLKEIARKSRDPISTLRNWAEALGMDPGEVVYHPNNTSFIDEIAHKMVEKEETPPQETPPQETPVTEPVTDPNAMSDDDLLNLAGGAYGAVPTEMEGEELVNDAEDFEGRSPNDLFSDMETPQQKTNTDKSIIGKNLLDDEDMFD